MTYFLNRD